MYSVVILSLNHSVTYKVTAPFIYEIIFLFALYRAVLKPRAKNASQDNLRLYFCQPNCKRADRITQF